MLEINAAPDRRDLNEVHARAAAEAGVLILVELRRALDAQPRADALRHRHRAAGVADAGAGGQHPALGGARHAAQAGAGVTAAQRRSWRAGLRAGARSPSPAACSALSFGVLAREAGMPPLAAIAFSVIVFAGSAQFAVARHPRRRAAGSAPPWAPPR